VDACRQQDGSYVPQCLGRAISIQYPCQQGRYETEGLDRPYDDSVIAAMNGIIRIGSVIRLATIIEEWLRRRYAVQLEQLPQVSDPSHRSFGECLDPDPACASDQVRLDSELQRFRP
jgi:hypothetical protein